MTASELRVLWKALAVLTEEADLCSPRWSAAAGVGATAFPIGERKS